MCSNRGAIAPPVPCENIGSEFVLVTLVTAGPREVECGVRRHGAAVDGIETGFCQRRRPLGSACLLWPRLSLVLWQLPFGELDDCRSIAGTAPSSFGTLASVHANAMSVPSRTTKSAASLGKKPPSGGPRTCIAKLICPIVVSWAESRRDSTGFAAGRAIPDRAGWGPPAVFGVSLRRGALRCLAFERYRFARERHDAAESSTITQQKR